MNISYTAPLSRAWERMKGMLFRPFRIETWLVLAFSAFLGRLFSSPHSGGLFNWNLRDSADSHHTPSIVAEQALDRARDILLRLLDNPAVLAAIAAGLIGFAVLLVALAWVGARAEFVFIDCVASRRARFVEPWGRTGRLGNSLFLWRAGFSFAYLPAAAAYILPFIHTILALLKGGPLDFPGVGSIVGWLLLGTFLLLALSWISMLTNTFVVPLMYRHDESALQAWRRFLPLLAGHPASFMAYTVFYVVLAIATFIGIVVAGFGTCCIGLAMIAIPYVGTVVLLPIHVTLRALGPEFLAQFGPGWTVFPAPVADDDDDDEAPQLLT